MEKRCPVCDSEDVKSVEYKGRECLVCRDCGYDERETYDVYTEKRTKKDDHGLRYKQGGPDRSKKK